MTRKLPLVALSLALLACSLTPTSAGTPTTPATATQTGGNAPIVATVTKSPPIPELRAVVGGCRVNYKARCDARSGGQKVKGR